MRVELSNGASYKCISFDEDKIDFQNKICINIDPDALNVDETILSFSNKENLETIKFYNDADELVSVYKHYAKLDRVSVTMNQAYRSFSITLCQEGVLEKVENLEQKVGKLTEEVNIEEMTLNEYKEYRQGQNKAALAKFLANNPLLWIDGQYYGVTQEDQNEMNTDLAAYEFKQRIGETDWKLEWHNIKDCCKEFTMEEFSVLLNSIIDFVYPYRRLQELYKQNIYTCTDKESLSALNFIYELK